MARSRAEAGWRTVARIEARLSTTIFQWPSTFGHDGAGSSCLKERDMRKTYPVLGIAIAAAGAAGCATAAAPAGGAPVAIPLRQVGRIAVRPDANICVELVPGRRQPGPEDEYVLGRVMAGSVNGIHLLMEERGVPDGHRDGRPRVRAMGESYSLAESCPNPARDLRVVLRLTQPRPDTSYRLVVEFHQGGALLSKGLDRRRQQMRRTPQSPYDPATGTYFDYGPPPWTLEGDAEQLTLELARLVRWETET
jgi:hypothetical protein